MKILLKLLFATLPITAFSAQDIQVSDTDYGTSAQQQKQECKVVRTTTSSGEVSEVEYCLKNGKYELADKKNPTEPRNSQLSSHKEASTTSSAEEQNTTTEDFSDENAEYTTLKQDWQAKLPSASGDELMMIYSRLVELAPKLGEQSMVKQYIRDMAFAWARDATQPGQACGFLKAVYEGLGEQELNDNKLPDASQEDILEIEYPYAKACFNAGQTMNGWKLLNAAFNRLARGTKLKDPNQINEMFNFATEVNKKLDQMGRKEELSTLSENVAFFYYKNNQPLKAAELLIAAADANDKPVKKEVLYQKAIEIIPKNEDYGKIKARKNLADYYIQSERYDDALLISQSIEAIANKSKDKEIKGFGYCKAGHVINAYNDLYEKTYLDSKTTKGMPKKNLELKRKAASLLEKGWNFAKEEKNQSWTAKCEYSLSYAFFNDYGPQHKLDDKKIFDLRLESGERFAQLNMNELAKSAFISSAYTALIYGHRYFGFKNPKDDKNKHGYQLGCQTYYRGVQLGLYKPEDEDVNSLIIPVCYKNGSRKY